MVKIKISVIVPAYNVENYLSETLDCLVRQSVDEYEVIIVNDGSTDGTQGIIDSYCNKHPHFSCIFQQNSGVSAARNTGLLAAKGKYVSFLDSDDLLSENALECFYNAMEERGGDIGICRLQTFGFGGEHFNPHADTLSAMQEISTFDKRLMWAFLPCNKCYRRDRLVQSGVRFPLLKYAEDGAFFMQYVFTGARIIGIPEPIMYYRRHTPVEGFSVSQSIRLDLVKSFTAAMDIIYLAATKAVEGKDEAFREDYLQEVVYKTAYILIMQFYRLIWRADDKTLEFIKEEYLRLEKMMAPKTKALCDKIHADFGTLVFDKKAIAEKPVFSAIVTSDSPAVINSVFSQTMPYFEVIVKEGTDVPERWLKCENLRFVGKKSFAKQAKATAKGKHVILLKSRKPLDERFFKVLSHIEQMPLLSRLPLSICVAATKMLLKIKK